MFTTVGAELLFEVVGRDCERLSLLVTANQPFEQWTEVLVSLFKSPFVHE
ncbi:ATP-binding protein [bacterium]|nr:ATP-binding protein [bacterium]MBU1074383.1 ATP-binding protein [bacterium]MBU1675583.1 ATP-binding protein [bacterium]